ncbi:MAG: hypothetical protein KJ043_14180, partial [Anaerolineae bacterium]|nr:hypothetical protein [Anaerolineae bacterium]
MDAQKGLLVVVLPNFASSIGFAEGSKPSASRTKRTKGAKNHLKIDICLKISSKTAPLVGFQ